MIDAAKIEELREDNRRKRALLMDYLTANAVLDLAAASLAREGEDGELCKALTSYQQADEEGVMVLVSRQACDEAATRIRALASENERLRKALLRLQTGAAVALDVLPEDQQEGVVGNFLAAIHRECCAGLCASKGADECKEATP